MGTAFSVISSKFRRGALRRGATTARRRPPRIRPWSHFALPTALFELILSSSRSGDPYRRGRRQVQALLEVADGRRPIPAEPLGLDSGGSLSLDRQPCCPRNPRVHVGCEEIRYRSERRRQENGSRNPVPPAPTCLRNLKKSGTDLVVSVFLMPETWCR